MLAEMLEKLLVSLVNNWKKYLGCFIGFVLGILLVEYGLPKTVFIIVLSIVGYKMGDTTLIKKLKKFILEKIKED
ncbi:DUF2273 domain-containing protein [Fusobacterium ulcerans]|jgi:uncharacterized membrane protein|uniref:Small integral membrane protein (DUF2273) n=2 Tax=Fusobacterium ulcerans TaxID=861 RepID=A0AAX1TSC4_9FUSO|nr:DUF2273 domain-containing protein [Fusobacterium ulcerans]AVQ28257.1 DUF2273 domain-containing protein [Fusobacterium ulcerans]EFS25723.1 hypothetical protein FUAG_01238 [Fusobacterium ulcerans ATCC 49185]EHO80061.1 hypothetical protein HMPREF0402_02327 [Fusobacterium ulcerans 12-1B]MCB8564761.1 DUF2273 domain-containing protein [Fusobacterium ulcerans]MCB8648857.1 DUF2273 domain-containing protein [Fusobacterium ulcerans]